MTIFQGALAKLLDYYIRYLSLVEKKFGRTTRLPFQDPVGLDSLKLEVKKFRTQN